MIYALILLFSLVLCSHLDFKDYGINERNRSWFWLLCFVLIFLAGFRYMNGGDTLNYYSYFKISPTIQTLSMDFIERVRYQPGFVVFVALCKTISSNFLFEQFAIAFFLNITLFLFLKQKSQSPFFCICLYFILNYFEFNMEIMRESLSIALGLWFWMFWEKKRYIVSLIFFLLAYSMHVSALALCLYPIVGRIRFSQLSFAMVVLVIPLIPFLYNLVPNISVYATSLFSAREWMLDAYVKQGFNTNLNMLFYVEHVFLWVIVPCSALLYLYLKKKERYAGFIYIFVVFHLLGSISYAFYRFANYFAPFFWIVLADAIVSFIRDNKPLLRQIYFSIFLIAFLLLFFYQRMQLLYDPIYGHFLYERYIPYQIGFYD